MCGMIIHQLLCQLTCKEPPSHAALDSTILWDMMLAQLMVYVVHCTFPGLTAAGMDLGTAVARRPCRLGLRMEVVLLQVSIVSMLVNKGLNSQLTFDL